MAVPTSLARQLDGAEILATLARLRDRIAERFPASGLEGVAADLVSVGEATVALTASLRRPRWAIRAAAGLGLGAMVLTLLVLVWTVELPAGIRGLGELFQASDAAVSLLLVLGASVFFLATLETRLKRRQALASLHQLRSMAHIVDMHQLTKDPDRVKAARIDTASSPALDLTPLQLGRYLDYCSELLSLTSKLAALHAQHLNDPVVLAAVNDVESLAAGLSTMVWQKISLLDPASR